MKPENTQKRLRRKKKLQRKYRNRRIALIVAIVLLFGGGLFAFSNLTAMNDVEISGTKAVSKKAVVKIARESMGKSYFRMNKTQLKNRLEQLPYVKEARIKLSFPHTLSIAIDEEMPFAQLYSGEGYILVNEDFRALEITRSYDPNLPKITGVVTDGVRPGQVAFKRTGNGKKIHMIKTLFASEIKKDIHTVSILDRGLRVAFSDGTLVHISSFDDAEYKTKQLEEIRKEMKAKNEAYREIYLDQGDHPVAVKPSSLDDEGPDENENMTEAKKDKEKKTEKKSGTEKMKKTSQNDSDNAEKKSETSEASNTAD